VLEVRRKLIEDWKEEDPRQNVTESIATDIARVVGVDATFPFCKSSRMIGVIAKLAGRAAA
jgi:hypothetical protein